MLIKLEFCFTKTISDERRPKSKGPCYFEQKWSDQSNINKKPIKLDQSLNIYCITISNYSLAISNFVDGIEIQSYQILLQYIFRKLRNLI